MISLIFKKFLRSRRAATAVAMAIMTVPLLIAGSAAVDFSRIASARTLLQASVDSAAVAGAGAYQTSQSHTGATDVAQATYNGTGAQLPDFVTADGSPSIGAYCSSLGTTTQCGTNGTDSGSLSGNCPSNWDASSGPHSGQEYCVVVTASVTLKNSLFAWLIPSELLSATGVATTAFPPDTVNQGNLPYTSVGSAGDLSGIYAYAVPLNGDGTTDFNNPVPTPNTDCSSVKGPLQYIPETAPATGVTTCNYLYIGDSLGQSGTGSISFSESDPVAFSFINYTGETSNYGGQDVYADIDVTTGGKTTNYPNGYSAPAYQTCAGLGNTNCTEHAATPLYGECPYANLYGSISQGGGTPTVDSLNSYSSVWEYLGWPTTHATNHVLTSFTPDSSYSVSQTVNGTNYSTQAHKCPDAMWPETTPINGPQTQNTAITAYATYYPDVAEPNSGASVYPPPVSGCTPVTSATTATPNATSSNPWWGWSSPNAPNYCTLHNAETSTTTTNNIQSAADNNCALVIQDLGDDVPTSGGTPLLPDYYNLIETSTGTIVAMDPVYDGTTYIELVTGGTIGGTGTGITVTAGTGPSPSGNGIPVGEDQIVDTKAANTATGNNTPNGYVPSSTTSTKITSGPYTGDYSVTEKPAKNNSGYDYDLPADTSFQCYDPQSNGIDKTTLTAEGATNNDIIGGGTLDPVANPEDGIVFCDKNPPETYALFWNDLGYRNTVSGEFGGADDLGYWNAVSEFTCPTPSATTGGGPATLSG